MCAFVSARACSLYYFYHWSNGDGDSAVSPPFVPSTTSQNEKKRASHAPPADEWGFDWRRWASGGGRGRGREAVAATASTCSRRPSPPVSGFRCLISYSAASSSLRPFPLTLTPRRPFRPRRPHFRINDEFHFHFSIGYSPYASLPALAGNLTVSLMGREYQFLRVPETKQF